VIRALVIINAGKTHQTAGNKGLLLQIHLQSHFGICCPSRAIMHFHYFQRLPHCRRIFLREAEISQFNQILSHVCDENPSAHSLSAGRNNFIYIAAGECSVLLTKDLAHFQNALH